MESENKKLSEIALMEEKQLRRYIALMEKNIGESMKTIDDTKKYLASLEEKYVLKRAN